MELIRERFSEQVMSSGATMKNRDSIPALDEKQISNTNPLGNDLNQGFKPGQFNLGA